MASGSVVVHDIVSLESFMGVLRSKRDELESLYMTLSQETASQGSNWQDPQYDCLKDMVDGYCQACRTQLAGLDGSIAYIGGLVAKLREL